MQSRIQPSSRRASILQQERELRMASEAIALVASGAAPRVVIAGIRYGRQILESVRRLGLDSGVRVNPIRQPQRDAVDLVVEPIHE